jgi:WbqC-like protein family
LNLLIDLHYLPPLEYFCVLQQFNHVEFERFENYIKQSYRNRCYIKTSQGVEMLIVPLTAKHGKTLIKDVRIDYSQKWQNNHWRTIETAYRKAPYFEYYAEDLKTILYHHHNFLFDLNLELLSFCLKCIRMNPSLSVSVSYEKIPPSHVFDLRSQINPKKPSLDRNFYKSVPYYQVFGSGFAENLSLIDLLFCEGPRATSLLISSQKADLNK